MGRPMPGHARAVEGGVLVSAVGAGGDLFQDALADPANDGDCLAVPDRLVARAVRTIACRLAAPRDQRVVVGHSLESFALARDESPNGCADLGRWHALASFAATAAE